MISTSQLADQQPTIEFLGHLPDRAREILGPDALSLLIMLHQRFNPRRLELLDARRRRQQAIDRGARPDFLAETADKETRVDSFAVSGADFWYSVPNHRVRAIMHDLAQQV